MSNICPYHPYNARITHTLLKNEKNHAVNKSNATGIDDLITKFLPQYTRRSLHRIARRRLSGGDARSPFGVNSCFLLGAESREQGFSQINFRRHHHDDDFPCFWFHS